MAEFTELLYSSGSAAGTEKEAIITQIKAKVDVAHAQGLLNVQSDDGDTMLHFAVSNGATEIVDCLLRKGANPNIANLAEATPLMLAVANANLDLVRTLVNNGAYINLGRYIGADEKEYENPLTQAVANKQKTIQEFFEKTASMQQSISIIERLNKPTDATYKSILNKDAWNYIEPKSKDSMLVFSIIYSRDDMVKHMLDNQLLFIDPDKEVLDNACLIAVNLIITDDILKNPHVKTDNLYRIIEMLLHAGADVNALDKYDETLLQNAAQHGKYKLVELLLKFHANVNVINDWGNSPLCSAATDGNAKICALLIKNKADTTIQNHSGDDCVTLAMQSGNHAAVRAIVGEQAMPALGYTPLMLDLLHEKYYEIFNNLLEEKKYIDNNKGAGFNAQTEGGFTALMIAAQQYTNTKEYEWDKREYIWRIIEHLIVNEGVDYSKQNKSGHSFLANLTYVDYIEEFAMSLWTIVDNKDGRFFQNCMMQAPEIIQMIMFIAEEKRILLKRFRQRINEVDEFGMTPLAYAIFDATRIDSPRRNSRINFLLTLVEKYGARYQINGKDILTPLHMKILWDPNAVEWNHKNIDKSQLNAQDDQGRTPLHYACMHNSKLVKYLIDCGARCDIKDHVGRTPLHYAAIDGKNYVQIVEHISNKSLELEADNFGISPVIYALSCSAGNLTGSPSDLEYATLDLLTTTAMNAVLAKPLATKKTANEVRSIKEMEAFLLKRPEDISSYFGKLAFHAAMANSSRIGDPKIHIAAAKQIIDKKHQGIAGSEKYDDNFAFGVEYEVPVLPLATFAPVKFMLRCYEVSDVHDYTVQPSLFSPYKYSVNSTFELVTKPITAGHQLSKTLEMTDLLCAAGAKVNKTAGLHVHFNVRGSQSYSLKPYVDKNKELTFLKFLMLNYISIEQLLRGFMREGKAFHAGETYSRPVSEYRQEILNCKTVAELQKICGHNKTVDLTALDKHGTVEFRIHEGAVDPTLVRAWVDCTARLVKLSKAQALQHNSAEPIAPKEDIEQLVYILVATRMYARTWDRETQSVNTAITMPPLPYSTTINKPAQVLIQEAPLYNLFSIVLGLQEVAFVDKPQPKLSIEEYLSEPGVKEKLKDKVTTAQLKADLRKMVAFVCDNPGIIQVNGNKEELFEEINRIFKEINKIQIPAVSTAKTAASAIGSPTPSLWTRASSATTSSDRSSSSETPGSPDSSGSLSTKKPGR